MATVVAVVGHRGLPTAWQPALRGLRSSHRLVAETGDVDAELVIGARRPEVVLLDLDRPREKSVALCRRLVAACADAGTGAPVIALADELDDDERRALLDAGASGYLLRSIDRHAFDVSLGVITEAAGFTPRTGESRAGRHTRTDFLRLSGAAATVALVVPGAAAARRAASSSSPSSTVGMPTLPPPVEGESDLLQQQRDVIKAMAKPVKDRRWVMVIDLRKCSGCNSCTIACKAENQLPPGVVYRPVIDETVGTYPNVSRRFLPRPCMHCEKPPCTTVCPVGATWRREDGVVAMDYDRCIGCRYCITACPYSARTSDAGHFYSDDTPAAQPYEEQVSPEYNAGYRRADGGSPIGNARKCHFCLHRLEAGMLPACVTSCIGHATYFGDANDPGSIVSELIGKPEAFRLKAELGTDPRVYYLT